MASFQLTSEQLRSHFEAMPRRVCTDIAAALIRQGSTTAAPTADQFCEGVMSLPKELCEEMPTTLSQPSPMETLEWRIQALPQELQDSISGYWCEFSLPQTVTITDSYKPPAALQLNRRLRQEFAEKYYSTTLFEHMDNGPEGTSMQQIRAGICRWARSLTAEHQMLLCNVRVTLCSVSMNDETSRGYAGFFRAMFGRNGRSDKRMFASGEYCLGRAQLEFAFMRNDGLGMSRFDEEGVLLED